MLTTRNARRWNWRLPPIGAIVEVHVERPMPGRRYRRFVVESYPGGHDGAHLVNLTALDNGCPFTVSGHWLVVAADYDYDYFREKCAREWERGHLMAFGIIDARGRRTGR